jgi:hypothetical protein
MEPGTPGIGSLDRAERQPHEIIRMLTTAVVPSRCLCLVAELGVADEIAEDAVSVDELARRCGVDADALNRVLRLLSSYEIFHGVGGAWAHTAASRLLRSDHPMSMRAYSRMWGMPLFSGAFSNLEHSVRTGAPAVEVLERAGMWVYLEEHEEEAAVFAQAMSAKAAADVAAVLSVYDFQRFATIADIGGGRGHFLRAILEATARVQGVLFDLPAVVNRSEVEHERLTRRGGDFFVDPLPSAEAYVLMDVLHDWDDRACVTILCAIYRAARPGATVLVIENVRRDEERSALPDTLDVVMLAMPGGRERTASELNRLFNRSGFSTGTIIDTAGPRIVEATALAPPGELRQDNRPSLPVHG